MHLHKKLEDEKEELEEVNRKVMELEEGMEGEIIMCNVPPNSGGRQISRPFFLM